LRCDQCWWYGKYGKYIPFSGAVIYRKHYDSDYEYEPDEWINKQESVKNGVYYVRLSDKEIKQQYWTEIQVVHWPLSPTLLFAMQ
jgi:hypothetical protein